MGKSAFCFCFSRCITTLLEIPNLHVYITKNLLRTKEAKFDHLLLDFFLVNAGLSCVGLVIIHDFSTDKVNSQIVFQVIEFFVVIVVVLPRPKFCRGY